MRITTKIKNEAILVFKLDVTTNAKISAGKDKILQVYSFSFDQFNYVKDCMNSGTKIQPKQFFDLAEKVCFDCPFRGYLKCYTHKYQQYAGFISMLKSIVREFTTLDFVPYVNNATEKILCMAKDRYIRFGTYGEPTLIPLDLVASMVDVSKSHTGYTHQWAKNLDFAKYFMASTHSEAQAGIAQKMGFRSFIATDKPIKTAVTCPASKEAGFKSTCEKCGLCSGSRKGKKHVVILEH